jgi:RNA polymerase sigma factor (sigma-70 family)
MPEESFILHGSAGIPQPKNLGRPGFAVPRKTDRFAPAAPLQRENETGGSVAMTSGPNGTALRQLRTLLEQGAVGQLSDTELIERFLAGRASGGDPAFAALVERHGPAVFRVCRSVLGDAEAAQDAFQATFLVLVRRAASVRVRGSIGPWLVAVAYRTASGVRSAARRRRAIERQAAEADGLQEPLDDDLAQQIRAEVDRLADRYRRPILLCYFAGLTHEGAARQLGCPVGTVRSRLAWGRKQLRERLIRRGLVPAAALASVLATPARAAVPTTLLIGTSRLGAGKTAGVVPAAAVVQAERVVRAMFMTRIKGIAAAVLTLALVATGGGVLAQQQKENPGSEFAAKKAQLAASSPPKAQDGVRVIDVTTGAQAEKLAPKVRPHVEIEMLLRAAKEQEQAGHLDQAIVLTTRMEGALGAWRADLQRQAAAPAQADVPDQTTRIEALRSLPADQARQMLTRMDVARQAVPFPETKVLEAAPGSKGVVVEEKRIARGDALHRDLLARLEAKVSLHLPGPVALGKAIKIIEATIAPGTGDIITDPIFFDPEALQKAGVTMETQVTLDVEGVPLRVALERMLEPRGLAYHVDQGKILVDAAPPK